MSLKPVPLTIEDEGTKQVRLNEPYLQSLRRSKKLYVLVLNGPTRTGKSTTCNHFLNEEEDKFEQYSCDQPFKTDDGNTPCSTGCKIVGPMPIKKLLKINEIEIHPNCPDADVLICDTEGFNAITGSSLGFIPSVLTAMALSTTCVFFSKGKLENDVSLTLKNNATLSMYMESVLKIKPSSIVLYASNYSFSQKQLPKDSI